MFSSDSRIPYRDLTLFVIGIFVCVFAGFFTTEYYFTSVGVVEHTKTANCFVDYLRNNSIDDDYFNTETITFDDEDQKNCTLELQKFYSLEDIKTSLYGAYDTSHSLCDELKANMTQKLCLSKTDKEGSDDEAKDNIPCINAKQYLTSDVISKYETSESFYVHTRKHCKDAEDCFPCVKEKLNADDTYMFKRLHARAIQLTYVNLEIWKYFKLWLKVEKIYRQTRIVEDIAVEDCVQERKCACSLHLQRKEA